MGYRSTVYGVVDEKDWANLSNLQVTKSVPSGSYTERFTEWLDENWEYTFPEQVYGTTTFPARNVHFFFITGIKWYRGGGGLVDVVENYLHSLPDDSWGMIIVGEESDDNEFLGSPYEFDMFLSRDVDMPGAPWKQPRPVPKPVVPIAPLPEVPVPINWIRTIFYERKKDGL